MVKQVEEFPKEIHEKLNYYVYRLIDPRNGETFYVGKGRGNRVFAHAKGNIEMDEDGLNEKMSRIRDILKSGFEVAHVIHRHGMNKDTALEVEAALIDAFPGLTNIKGGVGSSDYGVMHVNEIIKRYNAETADFSNDKMLIISVNRSSGERSLYDAVRYAWRLNVKKAENADYILATIQGLIVGVFIANKWLPATVKNFPALLNDVPGRYGFLGAKASDKIQKKYIDKLIPEKFRKKGASNPIKYTW